MTPRLARALLALASASDAFAAESESGWAESLAARVSGWAESLAAHSLTLEEFGEVRESEAPADFGGLPSATETDELWSDALAFEYEVSPARMRRDGQRRPFGLPSRPLAIKRLAAFPVPVWLR